MSAAELHHRELALFLSVHADIGPAVLWPEYEHPAYDSAVGGDPDRRLAQALIQLTGVPVRTLRGEGAASAARYGRMGTPTLAHQISGRGLWVLHPQGSGAVDFRCRLRAGEVLYIPASHMWSTTELSGHSRFLLTFFEGKPKQSAYALGVGRPESAPSPEQPGEQGDAEESQWWFN